MKIIDSEYNKGMNVEKEHSDITHGDKKMTSKIVLAHLKEIPDYYSKLEKMENEVLNKKAKNG